MRKIMLVAGILLALTCIACGNDDLLTWDGLGGNHGGGAVSETGAGSNNSGNRGESVVVDGDSISVGN